MKTIFSVIVLAGLFFTFFSGHAQEEVLMHDAVTKPALSLRCKELFKERAEKIRVQQKLQSLLQRNQDLMKKSPNARPTFHNQLLANQIKVKNEILQTNQRIGGMEENIIRTGCPGLSL